MIRELLRISRLFATHALYETLQGEIRCQVHSHRIIEMCLQKRRTRAPLRNRNDGWLDFDEIFEIPLQRAAGLRVLRTNGVCIFVETDSSENDPFRMQDE